MNTGALRHLATLDEPLSDDGVRPLEPPTWFCALREEGTGTTTLIGRYHSGITTATRVQLAGRVFHVDAVINRQGRDAQLELTCREVFE